MQMHDNNNACIYGMVFSQLNDSSMESLALYYITMFKTNNTLPWEQSFNEKIHVQKTAWIVLL